MTVRTVGVSAPRELEDAGSPEQRPTPVERSYLEVIAYLAVRREPVIAAQLVRWFRVRPPTVAHVIQRLEIKGLITRQSNHSLVLTPEGAAIADHVIRRHRLLERFLYDVLQVPWHAVHREAALLEPALSVMLEAQITAMVGAATTCPHGNPIPGQGAPPDDDVPLTEVPAGSRFVITRIDEEAGEDSCTLQMLWTRSLIPGTSLIRLNDTSGGVRVQRDGHRSILGRRVAGFIWGRIETQPATLLTAQTKAKPA